MPGTMRTCSQPRSRNTGQSRSRNKGAASSVAREVRGANFLAAKPTAKWPMNMKSEAPEELVEFVGGVEVSFEFAGGEALAEIVEAARQEVKRSGENLLIGEHD